MGKVIVVLHNVYSVQRVIEMAKLVYGLGFDTLIVSKAQSAAAQSGVPDAQKLALKKNKNFFYLADLPDVLELFKPELVLMFVPKEYASEAYNPKQVIEVLNQGKNVVLVFGGSEPGLTKRELELGKPVFLEHVNEDIGPVGYASIALYELLKLLKLEH